MATRGDPRSGHRYRQLRRRVFAEEPTCVYCQLPFPEGARFPNPASKTLEHLQPIELGGPPLDRDNCRAAHWKCNQLRTAAFTMVDGNLVTAGGGGDQAVTPVRAGRGYYCPDPAQCPTKGTGGHCEGHSRRW